MEGLTIKFQIVSAVCLVLLLAADGFAIVDQQFAPGSRNIIASVGTGNTSDKAQTFTVGITGKLTGLDVWVDRRPAVVQPLVMDIRRTQAGVPSEADTGPDILASEALPATLFVTAPGAIDPPPATLSHIELNAKSFPVVAGDVLAIVLRSDDPG